MDEDRGSYWLRLMGSPGRAQNGGLDTEYNMAQGFNSSYLEPWIVTLLLEYKESVIKTDGQIGHVLKVLNEPGFSQDAEQEPETILHIGDGLHYIEVVVVGKAAKMTKQSIAQSGLSGIIGQFITLQNYRVSFKTALEMKDCRFYLILESYQVMSMKRQGKSPQDCNQELSVIQKIKELWQKGFSKETWFNSGQESESVSQVLKDLNQDQLNILKENAQDCLDLLGTSEPLDSEQLAVYPDTKWQLERKQNKMQQDIFTVPAEYLMMNAKYEAALSQSNVSNTPQAVPEEDEDVQAVIEEDEDVQAVIEEDEDVQAVIEEDEDVHAVIEEDEDVQAVIEEDEDVQAVTEEDEDVQAAPEEDEDIQAAPEEDEDVQAAPEDEDVQAAPEEDDRSTVSFFSADAASLGGSSENPWDGLPGIAMSTSSGAPGATHGIPQMQQMLLASPAEEASAESNTSTSHLLEPPDNMPRCSSEHAAPPKVPSLFHFQNNEFVIKTANQNSDLVMSTTSGQASELVDSLPCGQPLNKSHLHSSVLPFSPVPHSNEDDFSLEPVSENREDCLCLPHGAKGMTARGKYLETEKYVSAQRKRMPNEGEPSATSTPTCSSNNLEAVGHCSPETVTKSSTPNKRRLNQYLPLKFASTPKKRRLEEFQDEQSPVFACSSCTERPLEKSGEQEPVGMVTSESEQIGVQQEENANGDGFHLIRSLPTPELCSQVQSVRISRALLGWARWVFSNAENKPPEDSLISG